MAEGGMSSDMDFQDVRRPPDKEVPTRGVLPEQYKIQTNFPILVNELACRPDAIIDSLYSKNVIDNDDVQQITEQSKNGPRATAKAILRTLLGCGPGAYNKFISCLQDNNFNQALRRLEPTAASLLDQPKQQSNDERWLCQQTLANGLEVSVVLGDLLVVHADVLVCSNYGTGSMEGRIAKKIRARAGPDYCVSLRELYKKKSSLKDWGVYLTFAGNLNFKCIYQVKIPSCPSGGMQSWLSNLEDLYSKILTRADKEKHVTVTLPLIGLDIARGPADQCVEAAINALQNHNVKNLSRVNIVSDDIELLTKLRQDLKSLRYSTDTTPREGQSKIDALVEICTYLGKKVPDLIDMPGIKGTMNEKMGLEFFNTDTEQNEGEVEDELTTSSEKNDDGALYKHNLPNGMVITLYEDDIVNISSDILVCYKYNTVKYRGRIDKHLKQVGGRDYIESVKSLEEEGDLESWKVYFTLAGNLQFHLVYQAVIPELDEENTEEWLLNLQVLYSTILTTADEEKRDSVTFPIIGIGPVDQCIEAFITTLKNHDAKTTKTIKIVANKETIIKKLCKGLTKAVGTAPTAVARRIPKETKQNTASISGDPFDFVSSFVGQIVNTDVVKGIYNEIFGIPVFKRGDGRPNGQKRYKPAIKEKHTDSVVTKRKKTLRSYNRRIPNGLVVFVYNEDIVDVHADILVVCNDKKGSSKRGLAKTLKDKGGRHYIDSLETLMEMEGELEDWKLYFTLPGNLKFKEIYQVIIPQKTDCGGAAAVALPTVEDEDSDDNDDEDDEDDDEEDDKYEDEDGGGAAAPDAASADPVAAGSTAVEYGGSDDDAGAGSGGGDRLQQLYSQILSTADTDKHESITIPLLGSGVSGGQTVQCIESAIGAIQTHPVTNLRHVNIVTKDDGVYALLRNKLKTLPTDSGS
ncbi:hypothetical protein SNE40_006218 [Patella caerulea]|uniref:Uncharacterized protein n=1 Tax=Patella caerulea TaxID=87958 RepID=A0AAN8K730_PATCE